MTARAGHRCWVAQRSGRGRRRGETGGRPPTGGGTLARRRPGDATTPATAVGHRWPHARRGDVITIELSPAHQHLTFEAPLSPERADTLVTFLAEGLSPSASPRVLDVGCGWAQLLLQVLDAVPAAQGIGVDIDPDAVAHGRDLASSLGLAQRADLRCADARTGSPITADAVICIGASQIWGPPVEQAQPLDHAAALRALRALVPRGGRVVHGESIWSKTPTPEAIAPLAGRDDEHLSLPALLEVAVACGFAPLLVQEATVEEWDVFESGYSAERTADQPGQASPHVTAVSPNRAAALVPVLVGALLAEGHGPDGGDDEPVPDDVRVPAGEVTLVVRTWPARREVHTPVVLVPATAETADDWDVVAQALSATRTVHALNLRGHGGSDWPGVYSIAAMAEDLAALLPHLSERPIDVVAHSLGGLVACAVAAAHPHLVDRLVLEDVALLRARTPTTPQRPDGELDFDWAMVEQVRPEVDTPDPAWPQVVAAITAPTLVIAGGPTSPVPQSHVADMAATVADGRLVTIEAGHLVHHHQRRAFTDAVRTFLDAR